jgi:DME family drug/metabolite transporter
MPENVRSPSRSVDRRGLFGGLLATATWALTGTFIHLVPGLDAPTVAAVRLVASAVVLLLVQLGRAQTGLAPAVPWIGVFAMAAYYVMATEAFTRAPVVEVTLLVGSAPVVTLVLELLAGRRVRPLGIIGVLIAVTGLAAFLIPAMRDAPRSSLGYLFAIGAAGVSALYVTTLRAQTARGVAVDAIAIATRASLVGAVASALIVVVGTDVSLIRLTARDLGVLALLGVVSTAVPTVAYGEASKRLPATVTTSLSLLTPLFAALIAGMTLGEWPAFARLPGCLFAFVGIGVVLLSN